MFDFDDDDVLGLSNGSAPVSAATIAEDGPALPVTLDKSTAAIPSASPSRPLVLSRVRFAARMVENDSDERQCLVEFHRATSTTSAFLVVARGKQTGGAAMKAGARYLASDCVAISKRENVQANYAMVIHFDMGTRKKLMIRAWTREASDHAWALWNAFNSAAKKCKAVRGVSKARISKPSRVREVRTPREGLVCEDVRVRERNRYVMKMSLDALQSTTRSAPGKTPARMPRGQGRRMQSAIKRTAFADKRSARPLPKRRFSEPENSKAPSRRAAVGAAPSAGNSFAAGLVGAPRSLGALAPKKSGRAALESGKRRASTSEQPSKRSKT